MAHFAHLDSNNIVISVEVVNNVVITDGDGNEQEQLGIDFLTQLHNSDGRYKQTSYNTESGEHFLGGTPFRKNYAGKSYTYDSVRDAFIPSQPYPSWTLNESTCRWDAPVTIPDNDTPYTWDEETTNWKEAE